MSLSLSISSCSGVYNRSCLETPPSPSPHVIRLSVWLCTAYSLRVSIFYYSLSLGFGKASLALARNGGYACEHRFSQSL
jgi:hypothetical protein